DPHSYRRSSQQSIKSPMDTLTDKCIHKDPANVKKPHPRKDGASELCRRSPNLPHTYACSTIGPTRLNFRVRDGNGCDPRSKLTGKLLKFRSRDLPQLNRLSRHL